MNKYMEALFRMSKVEDIDSNKFDNEYSEDDYVDDGLIIFELIDKETPMKPKTVMLFGEEVPICPNEYCGVGIDPNETIWHKSSYCGNCGQKLDWE